MITKKQRRRLHSLEKAEKYEMRRYQSWIRTQEVKLGAKLTTRVPRWRKLDNTCNYRGKAYYLWIDYFWEGFCGFSDWE